jgi:2-polyprenyl-3-methyl-5-hydroxy-6-metoxy-1,4-benzoquinol methylase
MDCIVCSSPVFKGLSPWHATCRHCAYESAQLAESINQQAAHALVNERDRETALRRLRSDNFRIIIERLARLAAPHASRLLDVGSAHGWFLEEAARRFTVLGIEPDAAVGAQAAARGLPVRAGYFPAALRDDEQFDLIVFNDVIEHIPDIGGALGACHQRLASGGLLVLNLPSSRGVFYKLAKLLARAGWSGPFDRMWQKDLPSPHVHYFNARNLTALVARHGFEAADSFTLPSLRASGLLERLRFVGKVNPLALYLQYLIILAAIPVLKILPSDIAVCVFRKR